MTRARRRRRAARDLAGELRSLFVAVVLGVLAYAFLGQPFQVHKLVLFGTVWLAAWLVLRPLAARLLGPRAALLSLIAWNLCLVLVVTEAGLELAVRRWPSPLFAHINKQVEALVRIKTQDPGWTFMGFPFNSRGWYDDELGSGAPSFRVVSIADSFAWGAVPHHFHFTTVCERLVPGTDVVNMGYSGTGPDVYDHLLRYHALPLSPQLIVVTIFVGNDLAELIQRDPHPQLSRFFDRDNLLVLEIPRRALVLARETRSRSREDAAGTLGRARPASPLTIWRGPRVGPARLLDEYPWLADPILEPPTLSTEAFLKIERQRALFISHPRSLDAAWEREFVARIESMTAAAGRTPIVFVLIPDEFQVEDDLWQAVQNTVPVHLERDRAQQRLATWFARNGVATIDLLPALRAVPPLADGRRHLYHLQDTHMNQRGHEVAGRALARYVARYRP